MTNLSKSTEKHANRWRNIPQFPTTHYKINVPWKYLESSLESFAEGTTLELDPDFQRGHVWSEDQQRAYVEYVLAGGEVGKNLIWNALDWPMNATAPVQLVDGLQRLTAVRKFIAGNLEVYGMHYEKGERLDMDANFEFRVCSLSRPDVLRLYLNINAGGTPHTSEELDRVRKLLAEV